MPWHLNQELAAYCLVPTTVFSAGIAQSRLHMHDHAAARNLAVRAIYVGAREIKALHSLSTKDLGNSLAVWSEPCIRSRAAETENSTEHVVLGRYRRGESSHKRQCVLASSAACERFMSSGGAGLQLVVPAFVWAPGGPNSELAKGLRRRLNSAPLCSGRGAACRMVGLGKRAKFDETSVHREVPQGLSSFSQTDD